ALAALAAPLFLSPFWVRIATGAFMWVALAQSWNIIGGYAGYLNFGHGAFIGVGAYATAILMTHCGVPALPAWLASGILHADLSLAVGVPGLRRMEAYKAFITWAFAEIIMQTSKVQTINEVPYGMRLPPLLDESLF